MSLHAGFTLRRRIKWWQPPADCFTMWANSCFLPVSCENPANSPRMSLRLSRHILQKVFICWDDITAFLNQSKTQRWCTMRNVTEAVIPMDLQVKRSTSSPRLSPSQTSLMPWQVNVYTAQRCVPSPSSSISRMMESRNMR